MPYICKVFDNLHMLWMGTWTCPHSVPHPSSHKFLEAELEFWVSATPRPVGLCIVWGYGPTPNRSHINAIHMKGGWEPFICCGWAHGPVLTQSPPLSLIKPLEDKLEFWVTARPHPVGLCSIWGYWPTPNRSHINAIHMQGGWEPSYAVDGHMDLSSLSSPALIGQAFGSQSWILGNCYTTTCRVVQCLRLWTHSKQIWNQCHTYARWLRTFICCGWAHGPVLTQSPHSHQTSFWKPSLNFG
jgi:hypothetical protein